ncbi:hypothetical protein HPP92_025073 [Vanilla planifolia]|uniref:Uncharacterized protein n=1 Tax=Vanilla planifolia TaxID=51239 RepID=A0A835U7E5_VANPL|nr:hypothetical protein HPP92_025073 [Vanilla planifolia]
MGDDSHIEIEEDEEEDDVDFNPVLRGETPSEASSSLSSENEGPCDGSDHNNLSPLDGKHDIPSPKLNGMPMSCDRESVNEDSETVMQFDDDAFRRSEVLNSSIRESSILTCTEGSSSVDRINAADNLTKENTVEEDSCGRNNMEPIVDDDDAIWRRTRARHSLVNYTLEELETFLQESDDDGVLQNVDDEEEYRKFLAAVLLEEDLQQPGQGDHNCDEDEDNDADFEIELEEALESDVDEATCCSTEQSKRQDREACVPETRQKKRLKDGYWTPVVDNPVQSILDVAPLRLAKGYMADIAEKSFDKGTSFALPVSASLSNTMTTVSPASCQPQPKKSLAATLVESTMKQSAALVPADISKSAQRFFHLFNPALFPHKPPVPAVANRVLFTDAEDGLLAMGLMEHNNDWSAIQQHFLPCKSKHQIFVRQKNRSSSKAPENPIKTVRRMKNSPLTEDEKLVIYEGLKIFKHDWLSIWKFFVPHRDPSLLPRQWRIATGTQKSYKKTEAMKEKRRLNEAKRRRSKALINDLQTSEKEGNDGDNSEGDMDCDDEAYVHEAFLADQDAGSSKSMTHDISLSRISNGNPQEISLMQYKESNDMISQAHVENGTGELHEKTGCGNIVLSSSKFSENERSLHQVSHTKYGGSYNISLRHLSSCLISRTSRGHLVRQSYRARKTKGLRVVKLAPDLPPVNLPPSVRVISQSAFKIYHSQPHHSSINHNALKDQTLGVPPVAKPGGTVVNSAEEPDMLPCSVTGSQRPNGNSHEVLVKENTAESDVQLHPLLFQTPSYFSINCQSAPTECDILLRSRCSISTVSASAPDHLPQGAGFPTNASAIEFHPLLRTSETAGDDSGIISSFDGHSSPLGALQGSSVVQLVNVADSECQVQRMNDLDLNIQLSSAIGRQSITKICENDNHVLNASILEDRTADEVVRTSLKPFNLSEKELEVSSKENVLIHSTEYNSNDGIGQEKLPSSHDISCQQCIGDFNEESNAGIVMEQEELSDSEDERENVVFECEDLEDSEEELYSVPSTKIHNKVLDSTINSAEIEATQDLHELQQSSHALHGSFGRDKGSRGSINLSNVLQQTKLTRPKYDSGSAKRLKSSRSFLDSIPSSPSRSKKRSDEEVTSQNIGIGTVDSKASGSRRSRRHSTLD